MGAANVVSAHASLQSRIDQLMRWIPSIIAPHLSAVGVTWPAGGSLKRRRRVAVWRRCTSCWTSPPPLSEQLLSLLRLFTPRTLQSVLPSTPVAPVSASNGRENSVSLTLLQHVRAEACPAARLLFSLALLNMPTSRLTSFRPSRFFRRTAVVTIRVQHRQRACLRSAEAHESHCLPLSH